MKPITSELAARLAPTIMSSVAQSEDGCWVRSNGVNPVTGYTSINTTANGHSEFFYAHRVMFTAVFGEFPSHLTIDHLCDNPPCCNPTHLTPSTLRDNVLRSTTNPCAINARKAYCHKGHELKYRGGERRYCAECQKDRRQLRREAGVPADESHGTRRAYFYFECRCDVCRQWQSADYLRRKAEATA